MHEMGWGSDGQSHRISTEWEVLCRSTIRKPMTVFYRFVAIDSQFYMELKVTEHSRHFVMARGAECKFLLYNHESVTLYSPSFLSSCRGCGARRNDGSGAEGIFLKMPISEDDIFRLVRSFAVKFRIYLGDGYVDKEINEAHGDILAHQARLIYEYQRYGW